MHLVSFCVVGAATDGHYGHHEDHGLRIGCVMDASMM